MSSNLSLVVLLCGCVPQPGPSRYDPDDDWDRDGFTETQGDCDDDEPLQNPGAAELCNAVDDDCDEEIDDDPIDPLTFYVDNDGDTWGGAETLACALPDGAVERAGDCDDQLANVFPQALEVCGDDLDQDCDEFAPDCAVTGDLEANDADERIPGMFPELLGPVFANYHWGMGHGDLVGDQARVTVFYPTEATFAIDGSFLGELRRTRAALAGDATGDGIYDVLAVFWRAFNESGESDVFLIPGPIVGDTSAEGAVGFTTLNGADALGTSVAAGDIDGDGYDDLLFGAPGWSQLAGAVFLLRGPDIPATGTLVFETGGPEERIAGRAKGDDALGGDLVVLGDVDGDGVRDVLAATVGLDEFDGAEVYLVSGPDLEVAFIDAIASFDWDLDAIAVSREDGAAVSALDDLDGDGLSDLAFSAPPGFLGGGGVAWVMVQVNALESEGDPSIDAFVQVIGDPDMSFGDDVAGLGDLDGDGYPELAVGCERYQEGLGPQGGAAFVLSGSVLSGGGIFDTRDDEGVVAVVHGSGSDEYRGSSLAALGDVDEDGWPDFAVGSGYALPGAADTWVFFGGPTR